MGPGNEYHQIKQEALTHLCEKQTQANAKGQATTRTFQPPSKPSCFTQALPLLLRQRLSYHVAYGPFWNNISATITLFNSNKDDRQRSTHKYIFTLMLLHCALLYF